MKLLDINIKDVVDMYGLTYHRMGYGSEYGLYENGKLTNGWRFNTDKNKAFDLAGKGRPSGNPLFFVMMYNNCSKEEAYQILSEKFYIDNNKRNGRKSNIRF